MEVKIISNNENKLLNRREISFVVEEQTKTANKEEILKEVCKKLSLNPEATIVIKVNQGFGKKESSGVVHSYDKKETLKKYEPEYMLTRLEKKAAKSGAAKEGAAEPAKE